LTSCDPLAIHLNEIGSLGAESIRGRRLTIKALKLSLKAQIRKWQPAFSADGRIKCWTIMERSTWQLLEQHGELTCPISHADDDPMFKAA
jgi:hypothetical protein